jgi:hypothetical protein
VVSTTGQGAFQALDAEVVDLTEECTSARPSAKAGTMLRPNSTNEVWRRSVPHHTLFAQTVFMPAGAVRRPPATPMTKAQGCDLKGTGRPPG